MNTMWVVKLSVQHDVVIAGDDDFSPVRQRICGKQEVKLSFTTLAVQDRNTGGRPALKAMSHESTEGRKIKRYSV